MTVMSDTTALDGMEPTEKINVRKVFGLDTDMVVHGFKTPHRICPGD
jgi:cobaltochelatase CobS